LVGLVVGLLAAAPAGFLVGRSTSDRPAVTSSASAPAPSGSLGPFEARQLAANRAKFADDLVPLAEPWMPRMHDCVTSAEAGGPKLGPGERTHVLCRYGPVGVHFALFNSGAERDAARDLRQRQAMELRDEAPGAAEPAHRTGTSGRAGSYVEYIVRSGSGKIVGGVLWTLDELPVGVYFEAFWDSLLGKSWEPLRDLWQRHS
jgi:hypothetical protein